MPKSNRSHRKVDIELINSQHSEILASIRRLAALEGEQYVSDMKPLFKELKDLLQRHFVDEEVMLSSVRPDLVEVQKKEHKVLSDMMEHMRSLMDRSKSALWQTAVIDQTIDALALHFIQEDEAFKEIGGVFRAAE